MDQFKGIDHSLNEEYVSIDKEFQRADAPPPVSPEWLALTEDERALMLEIANSERGWIRWKNARKYGDGDTVYAICNKKYADVADSISEKISIVFLTYKGAMIIPRQSR